MRTDWIGFTYGDKENDNRGEDAVQSLLRQHPRVEERVTKARAVEARVADRQDVAHVLLQDAHRHDGQRRVEHVEATDGERVVNGLFPHEKRKEQTKNDRDMERVGEKLRKSVINTQMI